MWESEDGEPGQWYGVKFAEKKDIKAVTMRVSDNWPLRDRIAERVSADP